MAPVDPADVMADMRRLSGEVDRMFSDLAAGGGRSGAVRPATDVYLTGPAPGALVVQVEVPGVDPGAIDIRLDGDLLVVRGARRRAPDGIGGRRAYHHAEIAWGPFERRLRVRPTVDAERVSAGCDAGILTITMPLAARAEPRQVPVGERPAP
jgi:HSP20 family protein